MLVVYFVHNMPDCIRLGKRRDSLRKGLVRRLVRPFGQVEVEHAVGVQAQGLGAGSIGNAGHGAFDGLDQFGDPQVIHVASFILTSISTEHTMVV